MCTYITNTTEVSGSALAGGGTDAWFRVSRAVVYFDHPQDAPLDHALCIDVRGGDVAERVAIELDAASARRLAETILATLDHDEVKLLVS